VGDKVFLLNCGLIDKSLPVDKSSISNRAAKFVCLHLHEHTARASKHTIHY